MGHDEPTSACLLGPRRAQARSAPARIRTWQMQRVKPRRTAADWAERDPCGPRGAGGTPRRPTTPPSTAPSSATTAGGRWLGPGGLDRGRARPARPGGRTPGPRGRAPAAPRGRAGWPPRGRAVAGRPGRSADADAAARRGRHPAATRARSCRPTPPRCRSPTASFDLAFSAYGARAVRRRRRRGASPRWPGCCARAAAGSSRSPTRSAGPSPTTPGPTGLVADRSYFDRTPYVERDDAGTPTYVEHHRTLGDRVRRSSARARVRRPRRAGVARRERRGLGRLVAAARPAPPRHGDLGRPAAVTARQPLRTHVRPTCLDGADRPVRAQTLG